MRRYLIAGPLIFLFCFNYACQDKTAMAELEKYRAQAKVEEENKALMSRMWEAWNKQDFKAWKEMHASDYAYFSPSLGARGLTLQETIDMGRTFYRAFPDACSSIEELIPKGDLVVSRWVLKGTQREPYLGLAPTGNKLEYSGIMITRIKNGKIVEDKEDWDTLSFMQQLGMELKPKEPRK